MELLRGHSNEFLGFNGLAYFIVVSEGQELERCSLKCRKEEFYPLLMPQTACWYHVSFGHESLINNSIFVTFSYFYGFKAKKYNAKHLFFFSTVYESPRFAIRE